MNHQEDQIIWRGEPTGEYTIHSGHKLLLQEGQSQRQPNYNHFYKRLWSLDLPPKIKITIWRFFCNFLPTFYNLHYKRLMGSADCHRCQNGMESKEHVFRECPIAKEAWKN
ncbi:hypothetical protein PVK06_034237 [Gossypium arboreum]|uniref:Reverse transcriptase zinc-binding domain-containing protein n=1 Tax=Gossypium arboreum TaxID=29729 RepID=A0ABR0NEK2_GOSAR|nr:hypothetical protein PVK06_034237 [Gossypium arboreum]